MMVNGEHMENISCRKCKHRHPAELTCKEAAIAAIPKLPFGLEPEALQERTEYIVVGDANSEVLKSTEDWNEAVRVAGMIRKGGGSVTIFKSTKG